MPADRLFCSSMGSPPEGWGWGGKATDGGLVWHRDWPFILKGLLTMGISAWGTGYTKKNKHASRDLRPVQQDCFYLHLLSFAFFLCVKSVSKWKPSGTLLMPLLKEEVGLVARFHHCALSLLQRVIFKFILWVRQYSRICAWLSVGVWTICILVYAAPSPKGKKQPNTIKWPNTKTKIRNLLAVERLISYRGSYQRLVHITALWSNQGGSVRKHQKHVVIDMFITW